jgi:predicted ATPase
MTASGRRRRNPYRIVLTGGPGGGKTTAADLFRREIGERIVVVPEAATLLFSAGFPRDGIDATREAAQRAIYHVQRSLEDAQAVRFPERVLLCDRGTVDSAVYWPGGPDDFFSAMGSSLADELDRYDAVIFFESAAVGGISIEGGNPVRIESVDEALDLDQRLRALWSRHADFFLVEHSDSFFEKMRRGLAVLEGVLDVP